MVTAITFRKPVDDFKNLRGKPQTRSGQEVNFLADPKICRWPSGEFRQADGHPNVASEPQLPVARLLDDQGLQLDEGPAPRRSMSRVRDAASGKPSVELKSRIQQLIQEPESSAPSPTPPSTADEGVIADRYRVPRSLEP